MFAASGLHVRFLKVSEKSNYHPSPNPNLTLTLTLPLPLRFLKVFEKSNYQTIKWVRYITKAGQYQHRI